MQRDRLADASIALRDGSHYEFLLPLEWSGLLDGINDGVGYISATSQIVPEGASLAQFLSLLPASIQFTDLDDLIDFGGISLDMILAALEQVLDSAVGVDRDVLGVRSGDTLTV